MTAEVAPVQQDVRILSLVSAGHFLSHFYMFALPALFVFLHEDLGFTYVALGALLSSRYLCTGAFQIPAGFLVDRYGAKAILIAGMLLMVTAFGLIAFTTSYVLIFLAVLLCAAGDAVFHPADYSILNGSLSEQRMGRAFSVHTFSGHLGFAAAPSVIAVIATQWSWQAAVIVSAAVGYAVAFVLITQWSNLRDDVEPETPDKADAAKPGMRDHARLLTSRPVMLLFAFFAMSSLSGNGLSNFGIPALHELHGTRIEDAAFAVSAYMLVSSFAVLAGGWIADRIERQDRLAAIAYLVSVFFVAAIVLFPIHYVALVFFFGCAGFCHGVIRPARDLMVREVAPKGSTGKVFAFIFTGQNVGGAVAPLLLGWIMDHMPPAWIFYASIIFMLMCIATILAPRGGPMTRTAAAADEG